MRLLLVEDDPMIGESLVKGLRDDGYAVDWVRDGTAGLAAVGDSQADFSIVILDWNLPRRCSGARNTTGRTGGAPGNGPARK